MKIEKNIPIPGNGLEGSRAALLRSLKRGESIKIPGADIASYRAQSTFLGLKIKTRRENETEFRLWRVK